MSAARSRKIIVKVEKASLSYGEIQTWYVSGLLPYEEYLVTVRWPGIALLLGSGRADATGQAKGSFRVCANIPSGNIIFRVELKSDDLKYGETEFEVIAFNDLSLPLTIYSDEKFDWMIRDPQIYRDYFIHKSDVEIFFPLPLKIFRWYTGNLGGKEKMNFRINFILDPPGGGWAGGGEFGIAIDAFWNIRFQTKGWWAYQLIAHEFGNLYTGETLSAGWPCDWWADHGVCPEESKQDVPGYESPAPAAFANVALSQINWRDSAKVARDAFNEMKNDKLFIMFRKRLIGQYGIQMFKRAFEAIRRDKIKWYKIDHGRNPSPFLTNYVTAYLSIGAKTDLSPVFMEYANRPYPEGMTGFSSRVMRDIIVVRNAILEAENRGKNTRKAWKEFRLGNYKKAFDSL